MITRESTKLLVRFKCNGYILLRVSSRLPLSHSVYNKATDIRLISGENYDNRRTTAFKHNCQLSLNLSVNRNSAGCVSNVFSKETLPYHKSHVSSIRHYTDFNHIRITPPSPFTNSVAKSIAESSGIQFMIDQLTWIHSYTGLPWWAMIIGIGLMARLTVFPLVVLQQRNVAKVQNLKAELEALQNQVQLKIMDDIEKNRLRHDSVKLVYRRSMKEEYDKLIIRENCHPLRGHVASLLQLPLWISLTFSIRNMSCMTSGIDNVSLQTFIELSATKFLWITNLTQYDPYYALPVLLGIINLANIEIHSLVIPEKYVTRLNRYVRNFARIVIIGVVPFISHMPSSIILYWLTSSFCAAVQNVLLLSPKFRRLLKIRHTETELQKPYSHLLDTIGRKLRLKKTSSRNGAI